MSVVRAVERVGAAIDGAHATNDSLNAFTHIEGHAALDRAAGIAEAASPGPLAGVPVALKDLIDHEGRVTTCGSAFYRKTAARSALCVTALEDAGAVIIGRTGLHEWAFGFSSENPHMGPVRNPWDPTTSPGGSSGGSGVAVAAGITPIAIGTDTGGSVRVPAALCGTFGLKVTHGRISLDGVFPLVPSADTVGPLADSIHNIDLAYRAMSGDKTEVPDARPLTIGVPSPWYDDSPTEQEIGKAFEEATRHLTEMGHTVVRIHMADAIPAVELLYSIADEVTAVHREFREQGKPYGADVAKRLDDAERVTSAQKEEAGRWRAMIRQRFADAFDEVDLLVTPSVAIRRKVIGEDTVNGSHYRPLLSYFSALVNQSMHPAIAMPLANSGAPPISIQAIAPLWEEASLIGFGASLERAGLVEFRPASGNSRMTGDR